MYHVSVHEKDTRAGICACTGSRRQSPESYVVFVQTGTNREALLCELPSGRVEIAQTSVTEPVLRRQAPPRTGNTEEAPGKQGQAARVKSPCQDLENDVKDSWAKKAHKHWLCGSLGILLCTTYQLTIALRQSQEPHKSLEHDKLLLGPS